jgi:hypothetical protein
MADSKGLALVLALAVCVAGCGGRQYLRAEVVDCAGVKVIPSGVWVGGGKLFVRLMVTNDTGDTIVIYRDQMAAHPLAQSNGSLVAGASVDRARGQTGWQETWGHSYVVLPGGGHAVNVEFKEQGFHWSDMSEVEIDFADAIRHGDQPMSVPGVLAKR